MKGLCVACWACNTRDMNTTSTTTQTMTLEGVTYTYVGMLEGVGPEFRTARGEFVGMPTHRNADEYHLVPMGRRSKIRGQFVWTA